LSRPFSNIVSSLPMRPDPAGHASFADCSPASNPA
jgi:hypothetical protein